MTQKNGRQGDVIRVPRLGPITPNAGHDLVALFLGACALGSEPDVPAYLSMLGFQRTHVFETALAWDPAGSSRLTFTASTPMEAAEGAVRHARRMEMDTGARLLGLSLRMVKLGPVRADGSPHDVVGKVFLRWSADSGTALEDLLKQG